jgi:hypothetical protein
MKRDTADYVATLERGGKLTVPSDLLAALHLQEGARVAVRVSTGVPDPSLLARGVTENEVAAIAEIQMEEREAVLQFLRTEGVWKTARTVQRRTRRS